MEEEITQGVSSRLFAPDQVCGKLRATIVVPVDSDQDTVVNAAMAVGKIAKIAEGKQLFKVILIKNKLVNLILK